MPAMYFTEQSVGLLAQCLLSLVITLYLVSRRHKSRQLWWLTGYAAGMTAFTGLDFFEATLYHVFAYPLFISRLLSPTFVLMCLLQFAYAFPNPSPRLRREARWASWLSLAAAVLVAGDMGRRIYRFQMHTEVNTFMLPYLSILGLEFLWAIVVLLRQTIRLSLHAGPGWKALITPQGQPARMARAFALLHAAPLGIVLISALVQLGLDASLMVMSQVVGVLFFLLGIVIAYFNHAPEPASLMVRLVGISLTTMLAVLGIIGVVLAPPFSEFYLKAQVPTHQRAIRFAPDRDGGYDVFERPFVFEADMGRPLDLGDDDGRPVSLPFAFPFYGTRRTQMYVNSDGAVSFDRPLSQTVFRFDDSRHAAILPMLGDFNPSAGGTVWVQSRADRMLVTWEQVSDYNAPNHQTSMQLILHADGTIDMVYDTIDLVGGYRPFDHREAQVTGILPGRRGTSADRVDVMRDVPFRHRSDRGLLHDYQADFRQYLHRYYVRLAGVILGTSLLIAGGFPLFFHLNLLKPLYALVAGVKRVNDGDLSVDTPRLYNDEIGFLTLSFNAMVTKLRELVTNLEAQVAERTRQLADRNAELASQARDLQIARQRADIARREAESANQAKSAFLANMTHELRSPLNAILGFAQIMTRSKRLDPENMENLGIMTRSGEHLLALINQVLDLSKIEAGRMTLNPRDVNLGRLLDDVEDMFRLKADDKHLQLVFERDPDVPTAIRTDELKLRQVLINLLNNALKFTERGGITVRVHPTPALPEGEGDSDLTPDPSPKERGDSLPFGEGRGGVILQFAITDTGPGIAAEELDKLFEAFEQTASGRQAQEGTGLGLPISRKFVQLMGGDIQVESLVGEGTTFRFTIDTEALDDADILAISRTAQRVIALEPGQRAADGSDRYRILVVDDKPMNRLLLVKLLQPLGFDVREAEQGQEAVRIWQGWQPHLIWMDLRMPVMDGYEATKQIKSQISNPKSQIPIIALTASSLEEERAVTLAAGFDDFLRKPFRDAEIFEMMTRHIGVRFVYEEEAPPIAKKGSIDDLPAAIAQLPPDLPQQLRYAVEHSDLDLIDRVIGDIREYQPAAAEALADWANNFQYEEILQVVPSRKFP